MIDKVGLFQDQEDFIKNIFTEKCEDEYRLLIKLLQHKEDLIKQLNNKIKDTENPYYSIELMLGYNLTLLNSSLINLIKGYLGSSQIMLRSVLENTCLSMYFYEFPKDEIKYRKNRKSFNCKLKSLKYSSWVDGWLDRIDKEGKIFSKIEGKENAWYNRIFINIIEEVNHFVHTDIDFIYGLIFMNSDTKKSNYALGPNWQDDLLMKNALWKIIESCLFSCAVLDRVFKKYITKIDMEFYKDVVTKLNNWKLYYQKESLKKTNL